MELKNSMNMKLPVSTNFNSGDLSSYISSVNVQPYLSADEELDLAKRYHEDEDLDAAQSLVLSHLRYVVQVARGFAGYGIPLGDLIQEGNIGLMKAVKRFDPERGVRLVSYATHWINAEIYEFILRNFRIVRIATDRVRRKIFFNLRKHRSGLDAMTEDEISELSNKLDAPVETIRDMEIRMNGAYVSFDGNPDESDSEESVSAPSDYLGDMTFNPERVTEDSWEENHRAEQLDHAIGELDERSRDIIANRYLSENKMTLQDLASKYGVSAERIRQIETNALSTMRNLITQAEPAY